MYLQHHRGLLFRSFGLCRHSHGFQTMHLPAAGSRLPRWTDLILIIATAILAACDSSTGTGIDDPEPAIAFQRILVADAVAPNARLFSLHNDSLLQTFTLEEASTRVYRSGSGRFAAVQQRNVGRVHFVDGGVWQDGQMARRRNAGVLGFHLADGRPSDENVLGEWVSIFFDTSGIIRWLRESELAGSTPRAALEVNSGRPHHGVSMTVMSGATPFFVHSVANDAGSPTGVAVRNQQGQIVAQVPVGECPGTHGSSANAAGGVMGCNNGMVIVRPSGASVLAEKVTLGGEMAGLALRNATSAMEASFILGQFAGFPGQPAQRVLATINPANGVVNRLPALPAGVVDHWRAVEPVSSQIVLLGNNGTLYIYNGTTRQLQHAVAGVVPAVTAGVATHQVAVVEGIAAVASPTTGEVVLVNLTTGSITRRINVGGSPSRLAILGIQRSGQFVPAR